MLYEVITLEHFAQPFAEQGGYPGQLANFFTDLGPGRAVGESRGHAMFELFPFLDGS